MALLCWFSCLFDSPSSSFGDGTLLFSRVSYWALFLLQGRVFLSFPLRLLYLHLVLEMSHCCLVVFIGV